MRTNSLTHIAKLLERIRELESEIEHLHLLIALANARANQSRQNYLNLISALKRLARSHRRNPESS